MKQIIYIIIITLTIFGLLISAYFIYKPKKAEIKINNQVFKIETVKSNYDIEKGLSGREKITDNQGMLFEFKDFDIRNFWMKNMQFPLDILFISDNEILEITSLQPPTTNNIPSYTSKNKVNKVLEINAGLSKKLNIKVGDKIKTVE